MHTHMMLDVRIHKHQHTDKSQPGSDRYKKICALIDSLKKMLNNKYGFALDREATEELSHCLLYLDNLPNKSGITVEKLSSLYRDSCILISNTIIETINSEFQLNQSAQICLHTYLHNAAGLLMDNKPLDDVIRMLEGIASGDVFPLVNGENPFFSELPKYSREVKNELFKHRRDVFCLTIDARIPLVELLAYNKEVRAELYEHSCAVSILMSKEDLFLRKEDFSLDTLLAHGEEVRQELYENSWIVVYLAREANILRDELLAYDEVVRQELYSYTCQIVGSQVPVHCYDSTPFPALLAKKLVERMAVRGRQKITLLLL